MAGELELAKHAFGVPGAGEQTLVVYRAEPGSPSADRLRLLTAPVSPAPGRPTTSAPVA